MPLPSGQATFEEAVAILKSTDDPVAISRQIPALADGLADGLARLSAIERGYLEIRSRLHASDGALSDATTRLAAVEKDRDDLRKKFVAAEAAPGEHAKRLDQLDTRVRTVEGAVGSPPAVVKPATDTHKAPKLGNIFGAPPLPPT